MDTYLLEKSGEKAATSNMLEAKPQSPPPVASPPSSSSSPAHEFSFTISLHHSSSSASIPDKSNKNNKASKTPPSSSSSFAIDLSPADDIFFHGHLLPLQFLSHLPVSPRSSANSLDSFTLPIRDLVDDHEEPTTKETENCTTSIDNHNHSIIINNKKKSNSSSNIQDSKSHHNTKERSTKAKSFSIFGLPKRRKECEEREEGMKQQQHKRKMRFDVSHILKRYARMVRPLLFFRERKENVVHFSRQPYSFSGNLSPRINDKHDLRGLRRGQFSAPASMRTSPTNSGILLATSGAATPPGNANDSTLEELQAAIQAAIAHCKNSIATEDKIKCLE